MRRVLLAAVIAAITIRLALVMAKQTPAVDLRYTPDGKMVRPDNYREWIWLSSGLGMAYNPSRASGGEDNPPFDNVFVNPSAYRTFQQTGTWPDQTILLLEGRASVSKGSINQAGHFQGEMTELEAHVKDESRFAGKWAFFAFDRSGKPATLIPKAASCYSCHEQHGAVDTTFVQFYPTLLGIAKQKGTLRGINP